MTTCGSCKAEVVFVRSAKSDSAMILDAKPKKGVVVTEVGMMTASGATPLFLTDPAAEAAVARVVDVYTDHHATCPAAAEWKGRHR